MASKQEKIKAWLIEQVKSAKRVEIICNFSHHFPSDIDYLFTRHSVISGINRDGVLIPLPDFQDDVPEPKDKALQEYASGLFPNSGNDKWIAALQETNTRIKDLEAATEQLLAAVARLEAANEKA